MNARYRRIGDHPCKVAGSIDDPNDCWPCLTPRANILQRTIRAIRRHSLPSYVHPRCRYMYKSAFAYRAAKNQQIYFCSPFVLHPFSMLAMVRLVAFFWFMLVYFIVHSFRLYFRFSTEATPLLIMLKILQVFFILTQFMVGYVQMMNEQIQIILSPRKILVWNLKRYMLIDILECLRICLVPFNKQPVSLAFSYIIYHVFIFTMIHRFFMSTHYPVGEVLYMLFGMSHLTLDIVSFLSFIAICIHYLTCFRYGLPKLIAIMLAGDRALPTDAKFKEYIYTMHNVLMNLYRATAYHRRDDDQYYELAECITKVAVYSLHMYVVVYLLRAARNTNKSKYKYGIMWNNMQNFLKNRNISGKLRYKILAHYQHKFQHKFFEEALIIDSLSMHLQYECQLHTASHLIVNTSLLRGLPKVVVGRIVASFKPVVYLPNDVIFTWHSNFEGLYFVCYGTVAIYNERGKEVMHLEDGGVVGATGYYLGTNFFTTTSVTITEIFKLEIADLSRITMHCPELAVKLKAIGRQGIKISKRMYDNANLTTMIQGLRTDGRNLRYEDDIEEEFMHKNI